MNYHSRRTSEGTKRAIAPYWNHYRKGKAKGTVCPLHDLCLQSTYDKRGLYVEACAECKDMEGFVRAAFMTETSVPYHSRYMSTFYKRRSGTFEQALEYEARRRLHDRMWTKDEAEKSIQRIRDNDKKFQEERREIGL